jgi:hypothetical protein
MGYVARMGEMRNLYKSLTVRSKRKRPLAILWRIWKDDIKMDLREIGCEGEVWIEVAQNKVK